MAISNRVFDRKGRNNIGRGSWANVGELLPDDLYVHRSAVDSLEPVLRAYEETTPETLTFLATTSPRNLATIGG
jgi:hypothetical protein